MGKPRAVEKRRCGKCKKTLPIESFNFKNKKTGKRQSYCRVCHKQHYLDNKKRYLQRTKARNARVQVENRRKLFEYLRTHPCVDCGKPNPIFLQFDHIRGKKKESVPRMATIAHAWKTIMAEIQKCEVRCVECHILKTAHERGHWMLEFL